MNCASIRLQINSTLHMLICKILLLQATQNTYPLTIACSFAIPDVFKPFFVFFQLPSAGCKALVKKNCKLKRKSPSQANRSFSVQSEGNLAFLNEISLFYSLLLALAATVMKLFNDWQSISVRISIILVLLLQF